MPPKVSFQMDKQTKMWLKASGNMFTVGELSYSAGIAADIVAEEARRRAPVGPTGNLKAGIVGKQNKVIAAFSGRGAAYVGANYKIAPHAHLVEYGGRGGQMPASGFMRKAIESTNTDAIKALEKDIINRMKKKFQEG